jgi:hypothetical protein
MAAPRDKGVGSGVCEFGVVDESVAGAGGMVAEGSARAGLPEQAAMTRHRPQKRQTNRMNLMNFPHQPGA